MRAPVMQPRTSLWSTAQDRDRVLDRGLADDRSDWKRRSSAASFSMFFLYSSRVVAPTQCNSPRTERRLQHVRGVHRAFRLAGADQGVQLVDEHDDLAERPRSLRSRTALRRSSNSPRYFGSSQQERRGRATSSFLFFKLFRHVAVDDAQRQTFDNCGLADTRLADQHRVVLGAARQDLDRSGGSASSRPITGSS